MAAQQHGGSHSHGHGHGHGDEFHSADGTMPFWEDAAKEWDDEEKLTFGRAMADRFAGMGGLEAGVGTVLDYGCGTGTYLLHLAGRADALIGVDTSKAMLEVAQHKLADAKLQDKVTLHQIGIDPATVLEGQSEVCDALLCPFVIHHVQDTKALAAAFARLVKAGGALFVSEISPNSPLADDEFKDRCEHHGFTPKDIEELLAPHGFVPDKVIEDIGMPFRGDVVSTWCAKYVKKAA